MRILKLGTKILAKSSVVTFGLMKFDQQLLRSLPKVLLHEHLDGILRPQSIIELAKEAGYQKLPNTDPQALAQWFHRGANRGSLAKYLEGFAHTIAVMQT